jgi:hypothetical protein
MGDTLGGESTGTQRRTHENTSAVGGTFRGFLVTFYLDGSSNRTGNTGYFSLVAVAKGLGEGDHLRQLVMLITKNDNEIELDFDGLSYEVEIGDDTCRWFHRVRTADRIFDKTVHICHPNDPHSLLILENTAQGLRVIPQGRWQEIGGQIGKLAAKWALANEPAVPLKHSGYKEPRTTSGDVLV